MKLFYYTKNYIGSAILAVFTLLLSAQANAQCFNATPYLTVVAPTSGTTSISTCTYQSEYNTITGVAAATTYISSYSLGGCITVTQGTPTGTVIATGNSPLNWTSTIAGTYYIHYTTSCAPTCGTASNCGATDITFVSGGGGSGPCASITPLIGCGTSTSATMTGTGTPWNITSCGFSTPGTESIFSFVPTTSGVHSIDVTSITGGFVDFFWMDATTGCSGNPADWNCISDVSVPGNYGAMNWTAGNTYYILLDPEGTGTYNAVFNVDCPNPTGPVVAGDCSSAQPVCTNLSFQIDPNGYGLVDELCTYCTTNPGVNPSSTNDGCLNSGELNSTWFTVNVQAGGTLEFSFGVPGSGFNCYDWIMWDYDPATTCTNIMNDIQPPVSCNWNVPCDGFTGISNLPLPVGALAGNFEPGMVVTTGDQFLICFSNYSSVLTTVPLNFFGSADISCMALPVDLVDFAGQGMEGYNALTWTTLSEVHNSHFEVERSIDGTSFKKIGEVEGAGTSLEANDYRFNDYSVSAEVTYYRLKQFDLNGDYKYTDVVAVSRKTGSSMQVVSAFPNPASAIFNVQLLLPESSFVDVIITSPNGKELRSLSRDFNEGLNHIEIPVYQFSKGVYFVSIISENTQEKEVIKFTVN